MIDFSNAKLSKLVIHHVGNKMRDEGISYSKEETIIENKDLLNLVLKYFLSSFRENPFFNFSHPSDLKFNEVFNHVNTIFSDNDTCFDMSLEIAKHLYEVSTHPNIKSGELYIVYLNDCVVEDEIVNAIGLFKSETKDQYLKINSGEQSYSLDYDQGINISQLDKGCLIFNTDKENGYKVCVVDNTNKSREALYWKESFLCISPSWDSFHSTDNFLQITKQFISKQLPEEIGLNSIEKASLLNESVQYFKDNESFDQKDFEEKVFNEPAIIDSFQHYHKEAQAESESEMPDRFKISSEVVKKKARNFKSVIKLDKNFHIYVHGDRKLIEKGYDEDAQKSYYKVYFDQET